MGRLYNTTVFSQQKGSGVRLKWSGAQTQEFDIRADDYEANRHYFLSQYFVDKYDDAMKSLPVPNSGAMINRIEVTSSTHRRTPKTSGTLWPSRIWASTQITCPPTFRWATSSTTRAFSRRCPRTCHGDDGRPCPQQLQQRPLPKLDLGRRGHELHRGQPGHFHGPRGRLETGVHYERVGNARLSPSEFTYNSRLGFISLRRR